MEMESVCKTERQIGNTLFIITEKCSPTARETVDEKLLKIMSRHLFDGKKLSESYQDTGKTDLLCTLE